MNINSQTGDGAGLVECLGDMVTHTCDPGTVRVEAGGSVVHGHPQLHIELEVSLSLSTNKQVNRNSLKTRCVFKSVASALITHLSLVG